MAIYDTVVAFEGGLRPVCCGAGQPAGQARLLSAAVHEAAYQVLHHYFPPGSATTGYDYTTMGPPWWRRLHAVNDAAGPRVLTSPRRYSPGEATMAGEHILTSHGWASNPDSASWDVRSPQVARPPLAGVTCPTFDHSRFPMPRSSVQHGTTSPGSARNTPRTTTRCSRTGSTMHAAQDARTEDDLAHFGTSPPPPFWTRNLKRFGSTCRRSSRTRENCWRPSGWPIRTRDRLLRGEVLLQVLAAPHSHSKWWR